MYNTRAKGLHHDSLIICGCTGGQRWIFTRREQTNMAAERVQKLALTWLDLTTQHGQPRTCPGLRGLEGKALDFGFRRLELILAHRWMVMYSTGNWCNRPLHAFYSSSTILFASPMRRNNFVSLLSFSGLLSRSEAKVQNHVILPS
jgi:hypothetical protein